MSYPYFKVISYDIYELNIVEILFIKNKEYEDKVNGIIETLKKTYKFIPKLFFTDNKYINDEVIVCDILFNNNVDIVNVDYKTGDEFLKSANQYSKSLSKITFDDTEVKLYIPQLKDLEESILMRIYNYITK